MRLNNVANVIDDVENNRQAAWMNDTPAIIVNIQRQPGANIISVVDSIQKLLPKLQQSLPGAVKVQVLADRTTTIRASVADVKFTLILTIGLVVGVIFVFLRTLSATFIAGIAVPLSLIGTFAAMYMFGFSINNLTLMALTISTGFVVDDAIVMIENIVRFVEEGEKPLEAALKGAGQIGFTIVALTISLIAVLIPLLFMGDIVGRLFREFAITLSFTILISAVVSLTLTPCSPRAWSASAPRRTTAGSTSFPRMSSTPSSGSTAPRCGLSWPSSRSSCWSRSAPWCSPSISTPSFRKPLPGPGHRIIQGVSEADQDISFRPWRSASSS